MRCVRIRGTEDLVTFQVATPREALRYEASGESDPPGDLLVSFELLTTVVKQVDPDGWVSFDPGPGPALSYVVAGSIVTTPLEPADVAGFPVTPVGDGAVIVLEPSLVRGLRDALAVASTDPSREVLNAIRLEPGALVASDGRQLFAHQGLQLDLPASGITLPRSRAFGLLDTRQPADLFLCREGGDTVTYAKVFQGPWTWTVRVPDLRYPNWKQVVPRTDSLPTRVNLSDEDVLQLGATLRRLPGAELPHAPVCLRVNHGTAEVLSPGSSSVRVGLPTSTVLGPDAQVAFNRNFLLRALATGFRELHLRDGVTPVLMTHGDRIHLWMPVRLDPPAADPVAEDAAQPLTA